MDYDAEMLKLYFFENKYTKEQINKILENNPFGTEYGKWERKTINENKEFAIYLRKERIIDSSIPIQEISVHKDNNVGKYLNNDVMYTECSIKKDINKVRLTNRLILFKGYYPNEFFLLKNLYNNSRPFITGICNNNEKYYSYILFQYKKILETLKNCKLIEQKNKDQKILILTNKNK